MKQLSGTADVVVIGGGVIGASIALHLSRRGVAVCVIEKREIAGGTSGSCEGLVCLQSKKPGIHLQMALRSQRMLSRLADELPDDIEYQQCGGLIIIETTVEKRAMQRFVRQQRASGLDVHLIERGEKHFPEPLISSALEGATYCRLDAKINPMRLTRAMVTAARRQGARIFPQCCATGISVRSGRVVAVETSRGRIATPWVVNACGVHAPRIGHMVHLDIPIRPRRGQVLVTEPLGPFIGCSLLSAAYIAAKYDPRLATAESVGISLEQTARGNLLIGSTREFAGFTRRTTIEGIRRIARKIVTIVPALEQVKIIRSFAGLRPYTPDGLPILGPVRGLEGFLMAAGHEGDGICLSAVTGKILADIITNGETDMDLEAFSLERFRPTSEMSSFRGDSSQNHHQP